eukprot:4461943-Amphidinium_carterae.3
MFVFRVKPAAHITPRSHQQIGQDSDKIRKSYNMGFTVHKCASSFVRVSAYCFQRGGEDVCNTLSRRRFV